MIEGALRTMSVQPGSPARYRLVVKVPEPAGFSRPGALAAAAAIARAGEPAAAAEEEVSLIQSLDLNSLLGKELRIEYRHRITCCHCGALTRKSYGEGHCYPCFRRLARCDLCVVSPARCHFAAGTCREPAWGESFCMQPHLVYLANASGIKVGITRRGQEVTRWLDQGAVAGLVVAETATRHLAGLVEAALTRHVSDRTDWRAMVSGEPSAVDLPRWRDELRARLGELPVGVRWLAQEEPRVLEFPVLRYPVALERLRLDRHALVAGLLLGVKGQYLLFEHGVLNVRQHRAFEVRVTASDPADDPGAANALRRHQMELFQ